VLWIVHHWIERDDIILIHLYIHRCIEGRKVI
jgi:hypothetical protein